MKKQTIALHTPFVRPDAYGSLAMPIYTNVSYGFEGAQQISDAFTGKTKAPNYARVENPTVTNLEHRVRALTGAAHVTGYNSGMAAISNAILSVAAQGKNIVSSRHLFGNTLSLITATLMPFGVKPRLRDLTDIDAVENAVDENTCCIFLEIVTNPQLEVADLQALALAALAGRSAAGERSGHPLRDPFAARRPADTQLLPDPGRRSHRQGGASDGLSRQSVIH